MSLILDALRRADAERERGAVPGLHTPQPMPPVAPGPALVRTPAIVAALVACAAVAGGGVVWWQLRSPAETAPAVVLAAPVAAPAPAAAVIAAPVPVPVPVPLPPPAPVAVAEPPPPPRKAEPPVVAAKPLAAPAPSPVPVPAPAPEPAAAPIAQPRPPLLLELAPAARQQLPQLTVSGASYSADPAFRMVIVNGQVTHEGDPVGNGVVLESIAPRQVVLRGMGQRWAVPY
jgi:general secretion pathway protein B